MHNLRSENTLKLKTQRGRHHLVDLEKDDIHQNYLREAGL